MTPFGGADPLLLRAMKAYRREHRDERARDPIRGIPAPRRSYRQFACRLCGFHWLPFRAPMPTDLAADRAAHRCWIPGELNDLARRLPNVHDADLDGVLRDRLEELTGQRWWHPAWTTPIRSVETKEDDHG